MYIKLLECFQPLVTYILTAHLHISLPYNQDFLQLGPLELKLLNITGKRMTIYQLEEEPSKKGKADSFQSTDWPVTQPMLKEATTPRS